jgi:hypothetical protein
MTTTTIIIRHLLNNIILLPLVFPVLLLTILSIQKRHS